MKLSTICQKLGYDRPYNDNNSKGEESQVDRVKDSLSLRTIEFSVVNEFITLLS